MEMGIGETITLLVLWVGAIMTGAVILSDEGRAIWKPVLYSRIKPAPRTLDDLEAFLEEGHRVIVYIEAHDDLVINVNISVTFANSGIKHKAKRSDVDWSLADVDADGRFVVRKVSVIHEYAIYLAEVATLRDEWIPKEKRT
jgi:hypothetical protein